MENVPYTNRELDRMLGDLKSELSSRFDNQDKTLNRIETQTVKTNGRVSKGERLIFALQVSISIFAFIVIPLCVYIYTTEVNYINNQFSKILK